MNHHYHVVSGISGYMPDSGGTCRTKREAENAAKWYADAWREDGFKVYGSARKGGYWIDRSKWTDWDGAVQECDHAISGYVEINVCYEDDCDLEGEGMY